MANFLHVSSTGSTNQDVLRAFREGTSPEPILADHQTAGRGRLGRIWHNDRPTDSSTVQAMLGSVPQTWAAGQAEVSLVPFAAGLAAVEAAAIAGPTRDQGGVELSWPNDVVVQRDGGWRKLAGILVESCPIADGALGVAVGVGMNLQPIRDSADQIVTSRAISLAELISGEAPDAPEIFHAFCDRLQHWTEWLRRDPKAVMAQYRENCCTIGQPVEFQLARELLSGRALEVADSGELIVDRGGQHHRITVGDVVIQTA
ncbi:MAG: biotin--[acetyl-CoA-carboxylase] ligase [Acidimicrobiales bacterium]|nr:biotin--[acetyl-CoA-carboxylase] ligase [Acidimicrobiales bacterium]